MTEDADDRRRPGRWGRDIVWRARNGHGGDMVKWVAVILVAVGMGGTGAAFMSALAERTGKVEIRTDQIEKRQVEDRTEAKADRKEIKDDVKKIDAGVQTILQKLIANEALGAERERRERRDAR